MTKQSRGLWHGLQHAHRYPILLYWLQSKSFSKNLGIIFDHQLKFDKHVKTFIQSCYFHLRTPAKICPQFNFPKLKMVIHAFVSSCLDQCNALCSCLNQDAVTVSPKLCSRLLSKTPYCSHITPVLMSLHCLSNKFSIQDPPCYLEGFK